MRGEPGRSASSRQNAGSALHGCARPCTAPALARRARQLARWVHWCGAMLMLTLVVLSQTLQDSAPAQLRLVHKQTLVARYNPVGLVWEGRLQGRFRLFQSESSALRDNFLSIGIAPGASPAYARIGAIAEVQPASFVSVWALYEVVQYFGTF